MPSIENPLLPPLLLEELRNDFEINIPDFLQAHSMPVPVSIRVNPDKPSKPNALKSRVPWCGNAYYLSERPSFTLDPLFHAGCYYVQEASSLFLEQAFLQTMAFGAENKLILDACSSPGGKSTHLSSLLRADDLLVSNETISGRMSGLLLNLAKWGTHNTIITQSDPQCFSNLPEIFDAVLVDAPCSGSGLFRKNPDALSQWNSNNVNLCSQRQKRIVQNILPALKPSGILIYSTCSYSKAENEEMADYLTDNLGLQSIPLQISSEWGIRETISPKFKCHGYRFFPHLLDGEGFYLACFRKPNSNSNAIPSGLHNHPKNKFRLSKANQQDEFQSRLLFEGQNIFYFEREAEILGTFESQIPNLQLLYENLKIKKWPLHAGTSKGKKFIPHPYSAYSKNLSKNIPRKELDKESALKYLRKEGIPASPMPENLFLPTYQNHPLGWINNIGSRLNNYFPSEWRIRMQG